jgi:hypothetical protein
MNCISSLFFVLSVLHPSDSILLDKTFSSLECYNTQLFVAPRIGQSIFSITTSNELNAIPVTDDVNYRIYSFEITPFAIFINRGIAIEKYYISYGQKEIVYTSRDISAFTITPSDEIILADRQTHEIIFLDFAYEEKFRIDNVKVEDLQSLEGTVYALTKNNIHIYDEYGNLLEKKPIPERLNRIYVYDESVLLYSKSSNHVYRLDTEWEKKTLPFSISDMCIENNLLVILDGTGTILYLYNRNDF